MRYVVKSNVCQAGGKFRRPVVVRVLDTLAGSNIWHWVRSGVVAEWRNVDSRYSGPRSAHGQALLAANELAAKLNS